MLFQRPLPAFGGVPASLASGATTPVTCKLDPKLRYHMIWLEFGNDGATNPGQGIGTLAANGMVAKIQLILNDKVQRDVLAVELNAINAFQSGQGGSQFTAKTSGTAGVAGYRTRIPICLAEPQRKVPGEVQALAWNIGEKDSLVLSVELIGRTSAGANGILDTPVITGWYEAEDYISGLPLLINKWVRTPITQSISPGEVRDLHRNKGAYQSIHLFPSADFRYVTQLDMTMNNKDVRKQITRFQNDATLLARDMNPTALDTTSNTTKANTGLFNLVFDYDDPMTNLLAVANASELTLRPTFDTAPANGYNVISQIVGTPD